MKKIVCLTSNDESLSIFSKTFELQGFKQLIDQVAATKKISPDQVVAQISAAGGPSLGNVTVRNLDET